MLNIQDFKIALTRRIKNEYYLSVAKTIAFGSSCPDGKQHGCIAVKNCRVISTGYNGPAAGMPHCTPECYLEAFKKDNNGKKNFILCPAVHAEINCLVTAAQIGISISEAVFYVTKKPCADCLKALRNANLCAVVYPKDEDSDDGTHFLLIGPAMTDEIELTI